MSQYLEEEKKKKSTGINNTGGINTMAGFNTVQVRDEEHENENAPQQQNPMMMQNRMRQDQMRQQNGQVQQDMQQDAQVQQQRLSNFRLEGDLLPMERGLQGNRIKRLIFAMDDVRFDKKTMSGDSWWMKVIKRAIVRVKNLFDAEVHGGTDLEALRANCTDDLLELIHSCRDYLEIRSTERDENKRHGKVKTLFDESRRVMAQVASLAREDYEKAFTQNNEKLTIEQVLEKDAQTRATNTAEARARMQEGMDRFYERKHFDLPETMEKLKEDGDLYNTLRRYISLQRGSIPADPAAFRVRKGELLAALTDAGAEAMRITQESAWLEKSKIRRQLASRLLQQLRWEQKRLKASRPGEAVQGKSWDSVFEGSECLIQSSRLSEEQMENFRHEGDLVLKEQFYTNKYIIDRGKRVSKKILHSEFSGMEDNQISHGYKGTAIMAELLGVSELFADTKEVTLLHGGITGQQSGGKRRFAGSATKGFIQTERGMTLSQAFEYAKSSGVNLIYSDEAIKQLTTIQIMDTICGQVNRNENGIRVELGTGSKEGENYFIIRSVMATNNEYSFGTAGFSDVNKRGTASTLKPLWDEKNKQITLRLYDAEFADRVLAIDTAALKQTYRDRGFDEKRINALVDRVEGVKRALLADRDDKHSLRSQYEANKKKKDYENMSVEEREKFDAHFTGLYTETYRRGVEQDTYVNTSLIRDIGISEELNAEILKDDRIRNVTDMNRYEDDKLHSVQERRAFFTKYDEMIAEDMQAISKRKYSGEFFEILALMQFYTTMDVTAEKSASLQASRISMKNYLAGIAGYVVDEDLKKRLLKMNMEDGLVVLENDVLKNLKLKMQERYRVLSQMENRDKVQEYELKRLKEYVKVLEGTGGTLKKPQKIDAREDQFELLDDEDKPFAPGALRDVRDQVLFPHPPCIQDVRQGGLGDCYFIATLASIVENDPSYIRASMLDNTAEGTVTVRFFDEGRPFYVTVNKSIPQTNEGASPYAKGALWVQMMEKAYVVSGLKSRSMKAPKKIKFDEQAKKGQRSYTSIESGHADFAFSVLTGKTGEKVELDQDLIRSGIYKETGKDRRVILDNGTIEFGGRMQESMDLVQSTIEEAQRKHRPITASSRDNFIQNTGSDPYSVNGIESRERGVSSTHEYSVLGLEMKNGKPYVRIRNPWGRGVVESFRNTLTGNVSYRAAGDDRFGSFPIDLKTFVTYFQDLQVGKIPTGR